MNNRYRKDRSMRRPPFSNHDDGPEFGGGPQFGGGPRHGRGRGNRRRGDIRTALLLALSEAPGHGYELIQRIEAKSQSAWRPSAGSVYPRLQLLEDEGLVTSTEQDGKRVYSITDEGAAEARRRSDEAGGAPWSRDGGGDERSGRLRTTMRDLHMAARQVAVAGSPAQIEKASELLADTRKRLYLLLGEE
jgi:DNA-binding PadR family transcriptional regulator